MTDPSPASNAVLHFQPEWCRVTLASIGDAVITTDTEGRVTFLNSVAESSTGWTLAEAAGQPLDSVFRILNEESRQPFESPSVRALREGVVVGLANHSLLIARDGTERPIDDSAAPIRNPKGEVAGVVLVFRDISQRRRQEQHVQEALSYADNIIATMREPFVVLDKSLRVRTANRAFYQNFHVSPTVTEGRFLYELGNGQWDIPRLRTLLEGVRSNSHPIHDFDVEHDFPAIGKKIMLLNARRFPPESNDPDLVLLAIEDITDRRSAEAAMKHSEVRYRRLFQKAKDGILILDADSGRVIDANPFMTDLLGYSHEEFLGKELWEIGLFRDIEESRAAYRELLALGYVRYEDLPLESRSGTRIEVEFVSNVYEENHHQVVQCNIRDITERSRLQRKVQEQAAALADLDRRKDEFLATLAHELRNPLAPLRNSLQIMKMPRVDAATVERSREVMERQVQQLVRLVDDLMDVSRFVQGKIELRRERVELATVVARAVETVRPVIDAQRHDLTISLPHKSLLLEADPVRMSQVVGNLLANAAKYTEPGGRIWLTAHRDGNEAVLRVKDTGIGIAPEILPTVFDLFVQVAPAATRSQGGLGIGLMLVKNLVGMHQGTVEAHSDGLGTGSEFVVRLPLASQENAEPEAQDKGVQQQTPRRRVLVVDDNVDAADSLAMLLRLGGHEVQVAHGGPAALEMVNDYRPEIAFLDIGMPGMDGYEVARRLREQPGLEGAVLVALTGWGQDEDKRRSNEAGFNQHLVKPVDPATLEKLLAEVGGSQGS
jgi:PAS domain S-box-containing protein